MDTLMTHVRRKTAAFGVALLLGLSACADLDVSNPNDADTERALRTAGDVESLIAGAFDQWWLGVHHFSGPSHVLANMSFQMSSWPANFGMFFYSTLPRVAIVNQPTDQFYANVVNGVWFRNYRGLFAIHEGLRALEDPDIAGQLGAADVNRTRMFAKFMQGLAHGSLALLYQEGFILDETVDVVDAAGNPLSLTPVSYTEMLNAALGYFDEAIALADPSGPSIPAAWMTRQIPQGELALAARSMKARYRANVARTPAERAAVDWNAVIADVDAGVTGDWNLELLVFAAPFWNDMLGRAALSNIGWNQESYMVSGMADTSGNYQAWLAMLPPEQRTPQFADGSPVLIHTPDRRFPRGTTLQAQIDTPGTSRTIRRRWDGALIAANNWGQPARGTHRWSYYRNNVGDFHNFGGQTTVPEITMHEMRLLKAEGLLTTDAAGAAALVNVTRVPAGLNATDAAGTNTSCVPKLPNGTCGNLLEMLKWEKRMHTGFLGVHANSWYFDGRGWGDLYRGTPLALPLPCLDSELLALPCSTTGGVGGVAASPGSSYSYPGET